MNLKPILTTERLFLIESKIEDAAFYLQLMNSPGWLEHIGDRGIHTVEDAEVHLRENIFPHYERHRYGLFNMVLKTNMEPIGLCGLLNRDYLEAPDIGFALLPAYARKGLTYEACSAVMAFAEQKAKLDKIVAITSRENTASQNLLQKIGLAAAGEITVKDETLLLFRKVFG